MVRKRKSKRARSRISNRILIEEEDVINQLPDHLICEILSHLPAKDAARASVLSTRWKSLWLWAPSLEFDSNEFPNFIVFARFGNSFFSSTRVSWLRKLKLTIRNMFGDRVDKNSFLKSWVNAAVKRNIQHLDLCCFRFEMPTSLYISETLVSLKLDHSTMDNVEVVSLPCLKILHLTDIRYPNEATFERLVSSCPVLEELEIKGRFYSEVKVLRVLSMSLKRLTTRLGFALHTSDSGIVIDAPRLCFLRIDDNLSEKFVITNMDSDFKLDIHFDFPGLNEAGLLSKRNQFLSFLPGSSKVRGMIICRNTFKLFCAYLKVETLPQFVYLYHLQVALDYLHFKCLLTFLESFPNLKSLILVFNNQKMPSEDMSPISFSSVPECLLSSLEFVDFKVPISGLAEETNLVRYFLENSAILKKLTLPLNYGTIQHNYGKKLLKIPRRSTECKVVFFGL